MQIGSYGHSSIYVLYGIKVAYLHIAGFLVSKSTLIINETITYIQLSWLSTSSCLKCIDVCLDHYDPNAHNFEHEHELIYIAKILNNDLVNRTNTFQIESVS